MANDTRISKTANTEFRLGDRVRVIGRKRIGMVCQILGNEVIAVRWLLLNGQPTSEKTCLRKHLFEKVEVSE